MSAATPLTGSQTTPPTEFAAFLREAKKYIAPDKIRVAADVGSRDGLVAIELARSFPNAQVYAFECNPDAIKLVSRNIEAVPRVKMFDVAIADVVGTLDFYPIDPKRTITPHKDGNIGASSLFLANQEYPGETYVQNKITVPATTMQRWANENAIDAIDVIWMDLQGAELMALRGLGDLISKTSLIYTEVEYREMYKGQALAGEVQKYLVSKGFSLRKKLNTGEWFGDELYVRKNLLPWYSRLLP